MPGNGGHEHKHGHGGHGMFAKGRFVVMMVVWAVWMAFIAVTMTWFIIILNRVASALKLQARVKVLDDLGDELTAEERAAIVGRVKARALSIY